VQPLARVALVSRIIWSLERMGFYPEQRLNGFSD